jgi:small subunit ribosomal protein S4
MGEPRHLNRLYDVPRKLWDKQKIISDQKLIKEFGLKTKKEIWKAETQVRKFRNTARSLLAGNVDDYNKRHLELFNKLVNLGILTKDHNIEDILKLETTDILERRLQTQVFRKGLALTPNQARQLIIHGHIAVNGKTRTSPSSLITINDTISYSNSKIKARIDLQIKNKGKPALEPKEEDKKDEPKKEENEKEQANKE